MQHPSGAISLLYFAFGSMELNNGSLHYLHRALPYCFGSRFMVNLILGRFDRSQFPPFDSWSPRTPGLAPLPTEKKKKKSTVFLSCVAFSFLLLLFWMRLVVHAHIRSIIMQIFETKVLYRVNKTATKSLKFQETGKLGGI